MKLKELIADVTKIRQEATQDGVVNKSVIYGRMSMLKAANYGVVEKKQSYNYISWTIAEIVMKLLDPEANVEYLEPIRPEMIRFKIRFLGVDYVSEYPILDSANQGAVLDKTIITTPITSQVVEQEKDAGGNVISSKIIQKTESVVTEKEELVFWQANTKSAKEGRKARVSAMNINNSHQRALAKEVSRITGFGIEIYTGEDLLQYG